MPTQTTNYGFTKDDINEPYDVLKVNANLDAIDTEIKEKETQIGDKANLITVAKTNLVAAINEVKEQTNSLATEVVTQSISVISTTDATSATNAPLKSGGGLAIAKKSFFGDFINLEGMYLKGSYGFVGSVANNVWVDLFQIPNGICYITVTIGGVLYNDNTYGCVAIGLSPSLGHIRGELIKTIKTNDTSYCDIQIINGYIQAKQTSGAIQTINFKVLKIT